MGKFSLKVIQLIITKAEFKLNMFLLLFCPTFLCYLLTL